MANVFGSDNKIYQAFGEALAQNTAAFAKAGRVVTGEAGTFYAGGTAAGGLAATLATTATSLSATDISTFEASVQTVHKVVKHTTTREAFMRDYNMNESAIARTLADAVTVSLNKDYFDYCEGLFAAAHPRAGTGAFQVGASKKYIDTGLKYLNGEGGEGTQANLLTAALSATALDSAIQLLNKYKSDRGIPLHLGLSGGLTLVVSPKNRRLALQLMGSAVDSSNLQLNVFQGDIGSVVVWNLTTDDDDWFLIDQANAPVGMYISQLPSLMINPSDDGLFVHMVAEYSAVPFKLPTEAGIVGSNVA